MISQATLEDVSNLVTLINSAYRGDSSRAGWTTEADLLDGQRTDAAALTGLLSKPGAVMLKDEADGALNGCVYLECQDQLFYLGMLTVSPQLQNAGIGKKLLAAAEVCAQANGINTIAMTVISVRHELIAWYERHGYRNTGRTKPFPHGDPRFGIPKQPLEFVVLEKAVH